MNVKEVLHQDIEESQKYISRTEEEGPYKRDLKKRVELINWTIQNMKNSDVRICELIESRMNQVILKINKTYDIFENDKLHSELRILDWIFFQLCNNEKKEVISPNTFNLLR